MKSSAPWRLPGKCVRCSAKCRATGCRACPKGWPADHPAADLLRYKQCYLWGTLDAGLATTPQFFRELLARFRAMAPFLDFLNQPLVAANRKGQKQGLPLHRI